MKAKARIKHMILFLLYLLFISGSDAFMRPLIPDISHAKLKSTGSRASSIARSRVHDDVDQDSDKCINVSGQKAALLSVAALLLVAKPEYADAAYGPSGAAVISQPIIKSIEPKKYLELSRAKQRQRDFGLVCGIKKDECQRDVDALKEEFQEIEQDFSKLTGKAEVATEEIARQKVITQGIEVSLQKNSDFLDKLSHQPKWVSYAAGASGSCVSTLIMHPLDTLKTRIMSGDKDNADEEDDTNSDENILNILPELYRGVWANVVKEAPASALYLGVYELVREFLSNTNFGAQYPLWTYLIAGAVGELVGGIIRAPAEAVKVIMQTSEDLTIQEAIKAVSRPEGIANTVRAWQSSIWRDVPMGAVQLALFESMKSFVINSRDIDFDVNTLLAEALFGSIGGAIGAFISTPGDIVTIQLMAGLDNKDDESDDTATDGTQFDRVGTSYAGSMVATDFEEVKSAAEVALRVYNEKGIGAFFEGAKERVLYWSIAISIFLSVYCSLRRYAIDVM